MNARSPVHAADVVSHLRACGDAFEQLNAIMKAIQRGHDVPHLAAAGAYIACDLANLADYWGG